MAGRKIVKLSSVIVICLTIIVINQYSSANRAKEEQHAQVPRHLSSSITNDKRSMKKRLNHNISTGRSSKDLYVVINTPKMGSDGLTSTVVSKGCKESKINAIDELKRFECQDGNTILRTHKFELGVAAVEEHLRLAHPHNRDSDGKCLIVTAIRNPASWFPSYFVQTMGPSYFVPSLGGCNLDKWPSEKVLLEEYRDFIHKRTSAYGTLKLALPGLLTEFGGGTLQQQFKIMDRNGGYSELGPAPPGSSVAGCKLLFLRMEESERWPDIFKDIDPTLEFKKGLARTDKCPSLTERLKVITDYEMTDREKEIIYKNGDEYVRDWFDAYGYIAKQPTQLAI